MIISILAVIITFGLVIFIHELGHFFVCKKIGIRVEAFAFGFGPAIVSWERGGTRYSINWIPLGGYVKPAGETLDETKGASDEYFANPWYKRLAVVLAGPAMNYLLAFVLFTAVVYFKGDPVPNNEPVIGDIVSNYPAHAAGLKEGDRVISVNGAKVSTWEEMAKTIHGLPQQEIAVVYSRGGTETSVKMLTSKDPTGKMGVIGIAPSLDYQKVGFLKSAALGAHQCYFWTANTVVTIASHIYRREKPDLAGPVGIMQLVGKTAHSGFANFVFLIGLLSVAIGIFNLFPLPILDGGHAVLYIWEGISRKKLTEKILNVANSMGMAVLVSLLLFATYNDIVRLFNKPKPPVAAPASQEK